MSTWRLNVRAVDDYRAGLEAWPESPADPVVLWAPARQPLWIGPVVGAGAACPECLRRRLVCNSPAPGREWGPWLRSEAGPTLAPAAETADLTAAERFLEQYLAAIARRPAEARRIWTVYPNQVFRHWVPTDASCSRCGDPTWRATSVRHPPVWEPSPKQAEHRVRNTADSWALLRRHVSPLTGVVTRLNGGNEGPLAGWGARHAGVPRSSEGGHQPPPPVRTGGKGVDTDSARVAAVGEAIERTALAWPADVPVIRASLTELGARALDPREVMGFSARQYADADRGRAVATTPTDAVIRHRIPLPLADDDPLDWVPAFPLLGCARDPEPGGAEDVRLVPAALVWFGHQSDGPDPRWDSARIVADSNGVATGATATEAAVYGLLEVIERDAVAMWWHLQLPRPQVDLDSCTDTYLKAFAHHCKAAGRHLWLLDLSNDVRVPVFVAVSPKWDGSEVVFGFGAHLDPVQAARAAAAECAQFLVGFERSAGADRHGMFGEPGRRWWGTRTLETDPHLAPSGTVEWPKDLSGSDQLTDLAVLCEHLHAAGLEAFAVPMSRPDVPEVQVIRVIVPGARSMFPRFAPGRLFDVPERLGWASQPLSEADVNPEEIFF